jgi:alpha-galactosidase
MNFEEKHDMKDTPTFFSRFGHSTAFACSETSISLTRLWDIECGMSGSDTGPLKTRGLCALETSSRRYEAGDFQPVEIQPGSNRIEISWRVLDTGLFWQSSWQIQPETGIWRRRDRLQNRSHSAVEIRRCLARIPFSPGRYEIYTQPSNWAHENQGRWQEFFGGILTLRSHSARTTQIATPYLFLREAGSNHGIAFHILPRGNWVIHVDRTSTTRDELSPFNVIELGLSDHTLRMPLAPGSTLELPEILIQDIPSNQPQDGSASLHQYLLEHCLQNRKTAPVVYNTWFDQFDTLDAGRLRTQLNIARKIGCEIFTVDAGWYGRGQGDWHRQVGDWREKLSGAFEGKMADFAQEVRAAGLGFGLWVEPERNSPNAPILQVHPEWFLPGLGGFFYPDLAQPSAFQYIINELSRLVEDYQLAWMKVDFNFDLGYSDDESHGYFAQWYRLMDELREKYPNTFFEGCASGGMRMDLNTLSHFDGHFLSDTVNPIDVLRITQGAMLRLPPGLINKWAVLRSQNDQIFTPGGGSWENALQADVDFICRSALPGMFGISGDLTGLSKETLKRLQLHTAFYKEWRNFLRGASCQLLTPICLMEDRTGWAAFQYANPSKPGTALIFVYRLLDGLAAKSIRLKDLETGSSYDVTEIDGSSFQAFVSGHELLSTGLPVSLPRTNSAAVFVVQPASDS